MKELEKYYKKNKFHTTCKFFQNFDSSMQELRRKGQGEYYFSKNTLEKLKHKVYEQQEKSILDKS